MTASLNAMAPEFENATGHKLASHFDSTPNLIARVNSDTPFDLGVVPVDVFKDAPQRPARYRAHHRYRARRLWRHRPRGLAEARYRAHPSVEAGPAQAPSIAFLPESAAGVYVLSVFERLGIAEA